jgi:NAD(P)-dependent dehydrogenase (short-subunit alcohol dehydrogenase family)
MLRKNYAASDEELQAYIDATALKRIAQPEDVAAVALFLASRLSDHVTGERIMATAGDVMSQ